MYQVLARKWRPKNFTEVIGQEHVVRALENSLVQQRLHHAYLFTGTRGIGKTTLARILAKCLNCYATDNPTTTPCGQCDACIEIDEGRFADLIEVDAASRTKVEDTRDLLDGAQYLPVSGRYKIYIIDEVHMLSGHSFNALLKTLEEPPAHVKFLLATTDPQKLPVTVLSRCLQFNLKKLPYNFIQQQLGKILQAENVTYEDQALFRLAIAADGSVRDALSLLDQAIAYGNGAVNTIDVANMLGVIDKSYICRILENLAANNSNDIMHIVAELASLAKDFADVLNELLQSLHNIAVIQSTPELISTLPWENKDDLVKLAKLLTPEDIQLYYQIGLISKRDLSLAPTPQSGFEMVMLRMLTFRLQSSVVNEKNPKESKQQNEKQHITEPKSKDNHSCAAPSTQIHNNNASNHSLITIEEVLAKIDVSGPTLLLLQHCNLTSIDGSSVELSLNPKQSPLLNKNQEERIQKAFSKLMGRPVKVTINLGTDGMITPATITKMQQEAKKMENLQKIEQNPKVQKILQAFNATVVSDGLKIEEDAGAMN